MDRRAFVTALFSMLAVPLVAEAQQAGKVYRRGLFHVGLDHVPPSLEPLRNTLKALGYEEGKNLWSDWRNLPDENAAHETAQEFVRHRVDLIVAFENQTVRAAKAATPTIPNRLCPRHRPGQRGVREEPRPARWKHHGVHGQWRRAQTEGDVP